MTYRQRLMSSGIRWVINRWVPTADDFEWAVFNGWPVPHGAEAIMFIDA